VNNYYECINKYDLTLLTISIHFNLIIRAIKMRNFNYYQPTQIKFGWGRVNEIGRTVARNGKKCLLVTVTPFPALQPLFEKIKSSCNEAGVEIFHFDEVIPNPTSESINLASEMAIENKVDVVLGVGGGSTIDTAKGVAVGATHEGDVWDYRLGQKRIQSSKVLPIIAIPTTAGTGAEVTNMAVIKHPDESFKSALADWTLCPKVSIIDPEPTMTVPSHITASTGFDTFCHLFESYLNKNASLIIETTALESLKLVIKNLPIVVNDLSNKEAREALAMSSTIGGICITNVGTTLPHGIGMAIGGHTKNIMHGEALAIMYPEINKWTWKNAISKYAIIGRIFNSDLRNEPDDVAAENSCYEMEKYLKNIGLWMDLEDKDVLEENLKAISEDSIKLRNYTLHPKVATLEDINDLIKRSYKRK
jgi:alcohol dehydrogenase class IV